MKATDEEKRAYIENLKASGWGDDEIRREISTPGRLDWLIAMERAETQG